MISCRWRRRGSAGCAALLFGCVHVTFAEPLEVHVYPGYGSAGHFVAEGRVVEARGDRPETASDSKWRNFWRTLRRLFGDEEEHAKVVVRLGAQRWEATADEEGYFRLAAEAAGLADGWQTLEVVTADGRARGEGALLMVPQENRLGIISDVDDTILVSEVNDRSRLLANTLFSNYAQREPVPGLADLYTLLARGNVRPEAAPVFYLSASPRGLFPGIQLFLDRNRFPRGVLITRKLSGVTDRDPLLDQLAYKTRHIEDLLTRLPHVRFILVGDDGEKDPEVFAQIRQRNPQRISEVYLRKVHPDRSRAVYPGQQDLDAFLGTGLDR